MSCKHTVDAGAYLFGSLELKERSAFERHLGTCEACRAELLRLAPLPGLLGRLSLADVENLDVLPARPPGPDRHRRVVLVCAAVLAALALAGGILFLPAPAAPTWAAEDPGTGVNGEVAMVQKSWGTEMWFKLSDVKPGARCKVVVFDRRGQREIGGWWGSDHGPDERIPGSTSFRVDQIDRLEVSDESGPLVTLRP
ncbi:Putative zinc-finger [Lentzea xinjiangensis]|uniref:Putative zinc-finger n=1 Tax=Lentzea xinjiangensis TaxID=402600 RepID=A0A1H9Q3C1_9PSEU|nr:zf-HC2 domain-containing protein [Lentzea xinjiangensis]SER54882.1 Putative zinc-finger [Lentzea xinjiangensis]